MTSVRIMFPGVKRHPGELSLLPAFIWKTIGAVSLTIRSELVMAGPCKGMNCLNPLWAHSVLCSDKCFLCFPAKSDLLKRPYLLFLFLLVSPQTTEFRKQRKSPLVKRSLLLRTCFIPCWAITLGLDATLRRVWTWTPL